MKIIIAVLVMSFSTVASAVERYMMICQSKEMNLSLKRELKFGGEINGWKQYWAQVDYTRHNKSGTLDAHISWRKDHRPGYSALVITLMDKAEAAYRKKGIEGGSVGFGAIDSRTEIKRTFKAKWSTYKNSEDAPVLQSTDIELNCEIQ